jgi:hypothetical protein
MDGPSFAEEVVGRLRGLYPTDDDPRVGWLPDDPAVAEAHLRTTGACDLVVGYPVARIDELDGFVARCAGHAVARGHADHRAAWTRWRAVAGADVLDGGVQLGADRSRLQVYLRAHLDPARVVDAFAAIGCAASARVIGNALALFSLDTVDMIGLELGDDHVGGAVYLDRENRARADAAAIGSAVDFLVAAVVPGAVAAWRAVADELLVAPGGERVFVSFEPVAEPRWVKVDVGRRPLALVARLAPRLGVDATALIDRARADGLDPASHVAIRFGGATPALSIYHAFR